MFHLHLVLQQHVSPKPRKYGLFDAELEMRFDKALIFYSFFFFLVVFVNTEINIMFFVM